MRESILRCDAFIVHSGLCSIGGTPIRNSLSAIFLRKFSPRLLATEFRTNGANPSFRFYPARNRKTHKQQILTAFQQEKDSH